MIYFTLLSRSLGLNVPHLWPILNFKFPADFQLNSTVIIEHTMNNFRLLNFAEAFFIGPTHIYWAKCSTYTLKKWVILLFGAMSFSINWLFLSFPLLLLLDFLCLYIRDISLLTILGIFTFWQSYTLQIHPHSVCFYLWYLFHMKNWKNFLYILWVTCHA